VTKTDGPGTALGDGDATSVTAAVTLGEGLGEGEAAGVVHATTNAPTNTPTANRITRQYAVKRFHRLGVRARRSGERLARVQQPRS
jgi:hypothetical protein